MRAPSTLALVVAWCAASAVRADVLLVDSSGAGDFLDLAIAAAAAGDGDTLVVRRPPESAGKFRELVVDGKGLTIVGLRDGGVPVESVVVRGLAADQRVVLTGFRIGEPGTYASNPTTALRIDDCAGPVRVQDCIVDGGAVRGSADVVFVDCAITGSEGTPGGTALSIDTSNVRVFDSALRGGTGSTLFAGTTDGGDGGAGAVARMSTLVADRSSFQGGDGGDVVFGIGVSGGDSAPGLDGTGSVSELIGSTVSGGTAGGAIYGTYGATAADVLGSVSQVDARRGELEASSRVEEHGSFEVVVRGRPGQRVHLIEALPDGPPAALPVALPAGVAVIGSLAVGRAIAVHDLGHLPASGELVASLATPAVPERGVVARELQALFGASGGPLRASEPRYVQVFDPAAPPVCGRRLHVDAGAPLGGDGRSWTRALRQLQDALPLVTDCDEHPTEVWVAAGEYKPAPPGGSRDATFRLFSGARLLGGFAGHETEASERDPSANVVVLSGDLAGDDAPGWEAGTDRPDNVRHVLRAGTMDLPERRVTLDGLTVRGGQADDPFDHDPIAESRGGGLILYGSARVVRCTFTHNVAESGGAIYFEGEPDRASTLEVVSSRIVANRSLPLNFGGSSVAGIHATSGGLPPDYDDRLVVTGSILVGNESPDPGAIASALRALFCELDVSSSVIYANPCAGYGAVAVEDGTTLRNCILWRNGPAQPNQLTLFSSDYTVEHCIVEGLDASLVGAGNIGFDPAFVDALGTDGLPGTLDDDLRLLAGSPAIDAGDNGALPLDVADLDGDGDAREELPLDLDGLPRRVDDPATIDTGAGPAPVVDIGPHEFQP